jgi:hypothetical protein
MNTSKPLQIDPAPGTTPGMRLVGNFHKAKVLGSATPSIETYFNASQINMVW